MSWTKVKEYPGWIYDEVYDDYISPKGRTASYPGAPFTGQVSKDDFEVIQKYVETGEEPQIEDKELEKISNTNYSLELVKTVTIGNVTVNWFRAV